MNKHLKQWFNLLLFCTIQTVSFAESPQLTLTKIQEQHSLIQKAATTFDINVQYLSAIIYTERTLNYDWTDETLDIVIAKAGKNSSNRPDILGTLYSTGLYHNDGSERLPHANPKANAFGKNILIAVDLFK